MNEQELLSKGKACLGVEADAIGLTRDRLDHRFTDVLALIRCCVENRRKLIFSGVGKNEPICEKIRATFNSTGVTAVYLDPLKALHGDLGVCDEGDLAFLFSNSGDSEELVVLDGFLKRLGVITVAFTSIASSKLAQKTDHLLLYHYAEEACPLSLAPTSSTTAALALGDALAMVFLQMRGFNQNDFAKYHPSGNLGRALLLRVRDIMRTSGKIAVVREDCLVKEALLAITAARCGICALVDPTSGALKGVFTDGDFRRASLVHPDVLSLPVVHHMSRSPLTIQQDALALEALRLFQNHSINDLIVVDEQNRPVGVVDGQDLPHLKLV